MAGITRRQLVGRAAIAGGGMLALGPASAAARRKAVVDEAAFNFVVPDPGGLLDLPPGFQYRVISQQNTFLSRTNRLVPGDHDGMAAFPGPGGTTVLVRNHELDVDDVIEGDDAPVPQGRGIVPYDTTQPGGTTGIIVGRRGRELFDYVTSAGTSRNCSGGPTPWNTWITCEETLIGEGEEDATKQHGYCFEVNPYSPADAESAEPIREMGFFSHEAIGVDPRTGYVYLTEDDFRGRIPADPDDELPTPPFEQGRTRSSFLYRFVPNAMPRKYGDLRKNGGKLYALSVDEQPANFNADKAWQGQRFLVRWVEVDPADAHEDALRKGAATFNRLEGADFTGDTFWFDDTAGGEERLGQVWRLRPNVTGGPDILELFLEATSENEADAPDNLVVAPWGDVWFCEDGEGTDRVMGITPDQQTYVFARNALNEAELCGCTFSPDGQMFFVNIQSPGLTFAIWGPFPRASARNRRRMGVAAPPKRFAPKVSGEVREAAKRYGMTLHQAAAFSRLGVPLG